MKINNFFKIYIDIEPKEITILNQERIGTLYYDKRKYRY